jgi:hypothetical protein
MAEKFRVTIPHDIVGEKVMSGVTFVNGVAEDVSDVIALSHFANFGYTIEPMKAPKVENPAAIDDDGDGHGAADAPKPPRKAPGTPKQRKASKPRKGAAKKTKKE